MKQGYSKEAALAFSDYTPVLSKHEAGEMTFVSLNGGLINHTWLVRSQQKTPFILQQINTHVFPRPEDVQHNYISISEYAETEKTGLRLPFPLYDLEKNSLFIDEQGNCWRAFEFIDNAFSVSMAETPEQAEATARTFAEFTAAFNGFDTDQLKITIPDFHNLSFRFRQFEDAMQAVNNDRMAKASPLLEELKKRKKYQDFYEEIKKSSTNFPLRVMHHDAKIANVLFCKETGKVICPVDFDTVMPGYFFSDIGDMIRSMACSSDENCTGFENLQIRDDYYKAILKGYRSVMDKYFTMEEKKYIHYAGLLMIYMQALRYMTDYLNGDIYYRIQYAEQNFDRAKNQITLLQKLEEYLNREYGFAG
jgi:thiamine kinase-like enzyme